VVTPSYNDYWTELKKMKDETYINIITGIQPVDAFDNFVRSWYTQGGQTITDEANAWYKGKLVLILKRGLRCVGRESLGRPSGLIPMIG
jgi:hypothetical protein